MGDQERHLTRFLGLIRAQNANGASIGSVVFAQMTAQSPDTLQWFALSHPLKIALSHEECGPQRWLLGLARVFNAIDISIASAVFAGLTSVTDRHTDRQTTLLGL